METIFETDKTCIKVKKNGHEVICCKINKSTGEENLQTLHAEELVALLDYCLKNKVVRLLGVTKAAEKLKIKKTTLSGYKNRDQLPVEPALYIDERALWTENQLNKYLAKKPKNKGGAL